MAKKFIVEIVTPYKLYLSTETELLNVKTDSGYVGILANHAPLIARVVVSKMVLKNEDQREEFAIGGGVLHVAKEKTTLLLDSIERASEIDIERAKSAKERAENRLSNPKENIDVKRAQSALSRALNRIDVSQNKN